MVYVLHRNSTDVFYLFQSKASFTTIHLTIAPSIDKHSSYGMIVLYRYGHL